MRRAPVLAALAVLLAAPPALAAPTVDTPIDYAKLKGQARLRCVVLQNGGLFACKLVSESPRGQRLGEAALALALTTRVEPRLVKGKPGPVDAIIPFDFPHAPPPGPPTPAPGQGVVRLRCTASPAGLLSDCAVVSENPGGMGLGQAALERLVAAGTMPGLPLAGGVAEANFVVPLTPDQTVAAAASANTVYGQADLIARPTPAQILSYYPLLARAQKIAGTAVLHCKVSVQGLAEDCKVAEETPPQTGFGSAAIALSRLYRYRPKPAEGYPVAGTTTITVLFQP